jgi:hypothetical protein
MQENKLFSGAFIQYLDQEMTLTPYMSQEITRVSALLIYRMKESPVGA